MFKQIVNFFKLWRSEPENRRQLDYLLGSAPLATEPLRTRLDWASDLIQWIRNQGILSLELNFTSGQLQATRIKFLVHVLERNLEWKRKVSTALQSILQDTSALRLFLTVGVPTQGGILGEAYERIMHKILPEAPNDEDLSFFFSKLFQDESDALSIEHLDTKTFEDLINLFIPDAESRSNKVQIGLIQDIYSSLILLAIEIRSEGLSAQLLARLSNQDFRQLPYFYLEHIVEKLISTEDPVEHDTLLLQFNTVISGSFSTIEEVYSHLEEFGVSINLVYRLERMDSQLRRLHDLTYLVIKNKRQPKAIQELIANLIRSNVRRYSFRSLLSENLSLLSRKISERSAETGDHYITRNNKEYKASVMSACGGGLVTVFTATVKILIYKTSLRLFFAGFAASLNYAVSFVFIQLFGFTLATKQPAMTATALAARMHRVFSPQALESLIDEIIHLIRSQVATILGNVGVVVPGVILVDIISFFVFKHHITDPVMAEHLIKAHSILGPTPLYAALTGVLLWLSSICAGWIDNWSVYHRIPDALTHNRKLIFVFREAGAKRIGQFVRKNTAGLAANISLGFLLGMTPMFFAFFSIPMDVRHVTLSSGAVAAASAAVGSSVFKSSDFWLAVCGLISAGILNILVAFSLAIFVAIRARRVEAPQRSLIYRALGRRLRSKPGSLFMPPATDTPAFALQPEPEKVLELKR